MRDFFLIKHHPQELTEVYQENPHQKRNLPDTRTIVRSLSNVKCRVVFWFISSAPLAPNIIVYDVPPSSTP